MTECSDERNSFGLFGASVWKDGFSVGIKGVRVASCESFLTKMMGVELHMLMHTKDQNQREGSVKVF